MPDHTSPVDDALQLIVDELIASFDEATGRWRPSWSYAGLLPHNATTGANYRGINTVMLWGAQIRNEFRSPGWATYLQWREQEGQVRKGEHGARIIRWVEVDRRDPLATIDGEGNAYKLVPKVYTVFNRAQVDGVDCEDAEEYIQPDWFGPFGRWLDAVPHRTIEGPPCYLPTIDLVQMPPMASFHTVEEWAATYGHELGHWTGHASRLDRKRPERFSGIEAYAFEELVAEISAGLTAGWFQIPGEHTRADHVQYIKGWLSSLREDPRILLAAAQQAQAATDHLTGYHAMEVAEPCLDDQVA